LFIIEKLGKLIQEGERWNEGERYNDDEVPLKLEGRKRKQESQYLASGLRCPNTPDASVSWG